MPELSYNTAYERSQLPQKRLTIMYFTRHCFPLLKRITLLLALLSLTVSCSQPPSLPTDATMLQQWQQDKAQLLTLIENCEAQETTVSLQAQYLETDQLINPQSLGAFGACTQALSKVRSTPQQSTSASTPKYLGKTTADIPTSYLFVIHQHREGTGPVEEATSRWTGGWISWKSSILEEKGFIYTPNGNLTPLQTVLPASRLSTDALDEFTGEYRVTSQISGNTSCEVWRIRPIDPNWALFYHQTRECPS